MSESVTASDPLRKPRWLRIRPPSGPAWQEVKAVLTRHGLHTVCDEARCPNKGECWGEGTATFMILGEACTRSCRFCAVAASKQGTPPRNDEAASLAKAASELGLAYVVLTSVCRDDLADGGAGHFAACIQELKKHGLRTEALIPDYTGAMLDTVLGAAPDMLAHNIETVPSLQKTVRDSRASFEKSLSVLRDAKRRARALKLPVPLTKTSILLGFGEKANELFSAMDRLRAVETDVLVLGQYLRPTQKQLPVKEYISPEQFAAYRSEAEKRGFRAVIAAPLARTSYHAARVLGNAGADALQQIIHFEGLGKPPGCKLIRLSGEAQGGVIRNISIRGDFFASPEEEFEELEQVLCGVRAEDAAGVIDAFLERRGIEAFGISGRGFAEVLAAALLDSASKAQASGEKGE
ncbi:MAG: lipoyl synthase [Spirochaetaceae bacterium]|jgi:lipoic acid synthetase|nr:lipoyl synthase [Spirochaetaceae bacterium]